MAYQGHPHAGGAYYQVGYGSAPGGPAFPGQTQDPLYGYFAAVAGQDGQIDADELQRCLTQSGIAGAYKPFNLETCRLMISMLDRDMSGTLGFNEFKELWAVLNGWRQHFMSVDSDHSGTVDSQEMQKALAAMGFRLSPQTSNAIIKRYSSHGKISFDDYIACCVKLRALTDNFRRRDTAQQGMVNFQYDDALPSPINRTEGMDINVAHYFSENQIKVAVAIQNLLQRLILRVRGRPSNAASYSHRQGVLEKVTEQFIQCVMSI